MNLSTAASSSRGLFVKSWPSAERPLVKTTAARSLAPKFRSKNAMQRLLHARAARQVDVQIVEHEQIDPAVHPDVRIDVRARWRCGENSGRSARAIGMLT